MAIISNKDHLKINNQNIQKVIEIAKDLSIQNKVLNTNLIYKTTKKKTRLQRKEILRIIEYLFYNNILVDGKKTTKVTILSNSYRNKIYKIITKHNGAHFSFLRKKIFNKYTTNSGQLLWHLNMLLKFNVIKKINIGNYSLFLPVEMNEKLGKFYFFLKDELYKKIIYLLNKYEKIKKTEVYKIILENREKVYYRLKILLKNNIISYSDKNIKEIYLLPIFKKEIKKVF